MFDRHPAHDHVSSRGLRLLGLAAVLALAVLSGGLGTAAIAAPPQAVIDHYIPDRYIVVFRDDVPRPRDAARDLGRQHGLAADHVYEHAIKGFAAQIPAAALN